MPIVNRCSNSMSFTTLITMIFKVEFCMNDYINNTNGEEERPKFQVETKTKI